MAGTVTFEREGSSIVIKSPRFPEAPGRHYPQIVGETPGGAFMVADLGDGTIHKRPVLQFRMLSDAHKNALVSFVEVLLSHTGYTCTYTDPLAVVHTNMRYISGIKEARRQRGGDDGMWDIDLTLALDLDP